MIHIDAMSQRMTRRQLYELVWSVPLTAVAPQFAISDVALKNTCRKFEIAVPPRGYWAKLRVGKRTTKVALPPRAAGMNDEVVVNGRSLHWSYRFTEEKILGPLPEPPSFPEDIALVRDRVRKIIGKVRVPREPTARHPAVERLLAEDEARRQRQLGSTYTFSSEALLFDGPFEQRRLRFLNALLLAVARCGGKAWIGGREAREISITVHQTVVALLLDRPPAGRRKAAQAASIPKRMINAGHLHDNKAQIPRAQDPGRRAR
jgi:hypothetical protein